MSTTMNRRSEGDELRLALAMRGGVSLAVWIAGACTEIETLRRSAPRAPAPEAADVYRVLCDASGYHAVTIDVLAGASAGGLNAVVLATSLAYGADVRQLRNTWLDVADLDPLSVPPDDAASLLNGDEFHEQLRRKLERLLSSALRPGAERGVEEREPRSAEVVDHLDIVLAATLLDPASDVVTGDLGAPFEEKRRSASFHFRMADPALSPTSTLPQPLTGAAIPGVARRLALAGRATASFPGAFEPVPVRSMRRPARDGHEGTGADDDLFGVFSEATADPARPFWVLDGGVLDNIPVARAIDAIAAARAAGPTERWLVFLHPSPPDEGDVPVDARHSPVGVRDTLSGIGGRETLLEDMAVLERHNAATRRFRVMRDSIANDLLGSAAKPAGDEPSSEAVVDAVADASRSRTGTVAAIERSLIAERAAALLRDPVTTLGADELTSDRHRAPSLLWPPEALAIVDARLRSDDRLPVRDPTLDLRAISRTAFLLVEWARRCEDRVDRSTHRDTTRIGHAKHIAYRLAATADLLAGRADLVWVHAAADSPPTDGTPTAVDAWVSGTLRRVQAVLAEQSVLDAALDLVRLHRRVLDDPTSAPEGHAAETAGALRALAQALDRSLDQPAPPATPEPGGSGTPVHEEMWGIAGSIATELARSLPARAARVDLPPVFALLDALRFSDAASASAVLRQIDEVFLPTATLSTTPPARIRFVRFSGTAPTARSIVSLFGEEGQTRLAVHEKLTGNQLFNFAAFLRPSWRANDWMWGRLDAAAHLVELLTRPDRLRRNAPTGTPEEQAAHLAEQIRRIVTATDTLPDADRAAWQQHFDDEWRRCADHVSRQLHAMFHDGANDLSAVRAALMFRRQWDILREEAPLVDACIDLDETRDRPRLTGAVRWILGGRTRDAVRSPSPAPAASPTDVARALERWVAGPRSVREAANSRRVRWLAGDIAANALNSALVDRRKAPRAGRLVTRLASAYAIRRIVGSQPGGQVEGR